MSTKTANVVARVEPNLKEQAEAILSNLGIPASTAINMFYHQIVLSKGIPFRPAIPAARPMSRDEMSVEEFNTRMAAGLAQAKANQSTPVDEAFADLIGELEHGRAV